MDQNVPETTDIAPRDLWFPGFLHFGETLTGFREGLKMAQCCSIEHFVFNDTAATFYAPDPVDAVQHMFGIGLLVYPVVNPVIFSEPESA